MEELRPQPIIRKRQKSFVPDEAKVRWMHKIVKSVAKVSLLCFIFDLDILYGLS